MSSFDAFNLLGTAVGRSIAVVGALSMLGTVTRQLVWFYVVFALELAVTAGTLVTVQVSDDEDAAADDAKPKSRTDAYASVAGGVALLLVHYVYPLAGYAVLGSVLACRDAPKWDWRPLPRGCAKASLWPGLAMTVLVVALLCLFLRMAVAYFTCIRTNDRRNLVAKVVGGTAAVQSVHASWWLAAVASADGGLPAALGWSAFATNSGATVYLAALALTELVMPVAAAAPKDRKGRQAALWVAFTVQAAGLGLALAAGALIIIRHVSVESVVLLIVLSLSAVEYLLALVCRVAFTVAERLKEDAARAGRKLLQPA